MNFWIFNAAPYSGEQESYTARQIYERRMQDKFWGLGTRTPNRRNVRKGDLVVFYIARREEQVFAGTARLASDSFDLNPEEQASLSHGSAFFTAEHGVWLEAIETWGQSRPILAMASGLKFIKDPAQWWTYLQGGVRQIEECDFVAIVSGSYAREPMVRAAEDFELKNRFALEAHLEEFIDHNWSKIPWGTELELYRDGEQSGRQYPAGTWSIDFLATDKKANALVVIELKRGQTSDATVGQVLRYMSWVREYVAAEGQDVRGIIVAHEIDDALRYAARGLPNVTVKKYDVSFALQPVNI